MNRRLAPFTPVDLTAGSSAHNNAWPIIVEVGAVSATIPSAMRPDKEQPSCRLQ